MRSTSGRPHPGAPPGWPCGRRSPPPRRSRPEEGATTHKIEMRRMNHLTLQRMYGYGGHETAARLGRREIVRQWEQALLFRNGALVRTLGPGAYRHWAVSYSLRRVDVRPWILQVPTQEIPTSDGVTVKVTVA